MRTKVALLLIEKVEILDFAGPFEVFSVTDEQYDHQLFEVCTVALDSSSMRT